jgi:hypothetical protein
LNRLIEAICPEEGDARGLEWSLNDDGTLDLYVEKINMKKFPTYCTF